MQKNAAAQTSIRVARRLWNNLSREALIRLREIATQNDFSVGAGDLIYLNNGWYVTHTGLVRLARRKKCSGIHVEAVPALCDSAGNRFVLKATVYPCKSSVGFVGYGDADPSNVSSLVRGAEMRVAETRAVNRALRKAYGIGICSVEEMGSRAEPSQESSEARKLPPQPTNGNGSRTVRDRLCQLIRQHQLDPHLVKAYATDFCSVKTLRDATRDQVQTFVTHLADWAEKDRNALLCQLNSYLRQNAGAA
jgi:AraC-like DNA-binding protein